MNCETIDAILDQHRTARLDQPERQAVAAHLGDCVRCSEGWAAHDALLGENMGDPPPELLARAFRRVSGHHAAARVGSRRSIAFAAAAAAAAVVAAVAVMSDTGLNAVSTALLSRVAVTFSSSGADSTDGGPVAPDAAATVAAAEPAFAAGRDYEVLARPAAAPAADGRITVIEFFMWPCFHCYTFEPDLAAWNTAEQQHVALTRVPVVWNREAELHARAFYTAEVLGKLDAMHAAFYDEIHARGNRLASAAALAEFFEGFGVEVAAFDEVFNSREVDARVQRAVALGREYGIRATPSLVVGGRYSTNPSLAGTRMLAVADYLVAAAAAEGCRGQPAGDQPGARATCPSRRPGTR
jgi:thiol:disulfide interchange protein DsbA